MNKKTSFFLFFSLIICSFFYFNIPVAQGFTLPFRDLGYGGKYISQSVADPILMYAGESREVTVKIKNIGSKTWASTGANYVSVYTVDPSYRSSVFYGKDWLAKDQPVKTARAIKPGEIGEFKIKLYAPAKTGEYMEKFYLAAENKTWIKGTSFYLKIKVAPAKPITTEDETVGSAGNSVGGKEEVSVPAQYQADLLAFSSSKIEAAGGEQISFVVRYLNTGTATWTAYLWQEAGSMYTGTSTESIKVNLAAPTWLSAKKIISNATAVVPQQPFDLVFNFRTPAKKGDYLARFQLSADGHSVAGGLLELPIKVLSDAPASYQETTFIATRELINEPKIRVGLYKTSESVKFKSGYDYQVYSGAIPRGILPANSTATLSYKNGNYTFVGGDLNFTGTEYIRLVPENPANYFTLTNYNRPVSWKGNKNFNIYRGSMEYVYSPKNDMPYIINELPLDEYIAGIGETSNGAAIEYIKAILVAARSYAYTKILAGINSPSPSFDVFATTVDQLYLGYNSEVLMPRVVQAAQVTMGEMVTYSGNPVVTPYFGNSDGMTRLWSKVWGGKDKPWIVPVECVYDQGEKMFGHGVGMSAHDASERAAKDGWTYDQLLRYYYTGVEVEKIY